MRSAILLLCIFTATSADISLISLGTKNAADDGYVYNRPSIPFDLPPKEVIIKPNPGPPGPVIAVTPRTNYNYATPSSPFRQNEVPNASKPLRVTDTQQVIITPRPRPTSSSSKGYDYPTPSSPPAKGYSYEPPQPQLKYPNSVQEENRKAIQQIKIPVSTRPTTTTARPTPNIIQSSYLPPETTRQTTTTTTTKRPTTARSIDVSKDGYTYEKPAIPFESGDNKIKIIPPTPKQITTPKPVPSVYLPPSSTPITTLRTTTPRQIQSSYLPPETTRKTTTTTTTRRPTTARLIDVTKDGYTYEKPAIPFESGDNKIKIIPPTPKQITTPKPVPSVYLPPSSTPITTLRTTTPRQIQSSYLPSETTRKTTTTTTTRRPTTARLIDVTKDGYTYEKPAIPFESGDNKIKIIPPTPKQITTPKPVPSVYLPPSTPITTLRTTTPRQIQSSYLPPETTRKTTTTTTTRRPTTARLIDVTKDGYTYEKPAIPFESGDNKIKIIPPTPKQITTPKPVPSVYLPPSTPITTLRTTTPRQIQSSYLPPETTRKTTTTTTTRRPTTARLIDVTKDGYTYEKPAIPFESGDNKIKIIPPTPKQITTPKPVPSVYLPPSSTPITTLRTTTPRQIQSSYLPPETTRQTTTTTTTRRPTTARLIDVTKDGYTYEKPAIPFESGDNKIKIIPPTPKQITTPKPVPSVYLPPSSTPITTLRTTTPRQIQSSYLPPETTRKTTTTTTTRRPTTARLIDVTKDGYTYEKPAIPFESGDNKIKIIPPTPKQITTPKPVPSVYLPPSTPITTLRTTTPRQIQSSYLPPETTRKTTTTTTTRRPTTARLIDVTKDGYTYEKPAIPFESGDNKIKIIPPTPKQITTPKPVPSVYLPPSTPITTLRTTTPRQIQSSYLPPETTRQTTTTTTTRRPTTARLIDVTKDGYTYEKPAIPFESGDNKIKIIPPTPKQITTPKPVPSVYLPPSSTPITTLRTTTPRQIQSSYLPPETTRQTTTTTTSHPSQSRGGYKYEKPNVPAEAKTTDTRRPTSTVPARQITNTVRGGYKYEKPDVPLGSISSTLKEVSLQKPSTSNTYLPPSDNLTVKVSTTTRPKTTTNRPTTAPTVRSVASTYLPPNQIPQQSKNNVNNRKVEIIPAPKSVASTYLPPSTKPTVKFSTPAVTSTRSTASPSQKYVASTYLPPNEKPQQSKIEINTQKPTIRTTTKRPAVTSTPQIIASTYLPPNERPEQSKTNLNTQRPITSATVRVTPKIVPSTYLPPTAPPTLKSVASTYLPPNEKPEQSKTNLNRQIPTTRLTTVRTTPKSIPSTYLPPSEKTTVRQQETTRATTTRGTVKPSPIYVPSTYLPPNEKPEQSKTNLNRQIPTTRLTTVRTTAKSIPSTYLPPNEKTTVRQQETTRATTTRGTVKPSPKSVASTYLPPNEKPEQSKTNLNRQIPTTRLTTVRTTPKSIPSTYLPPSEKTTVRQQETTRARTTTRSTVKPSPKSVPSTYLPPNEKPEQSKNNLNRQIPLTRVTTVRTTPKSIPSTYLPPKEKPTIKVQTTPATKSLVSTYLPPNEKPEQSKSNLNFQNPTTTTIRTTVKTVPPTYLPPVAEDGYHYPKPAIPFTF